MHYLNTLLDYEITSQVGFITSDNHVVDDKLCRDLSTA